MGAGSPEALFHSCIELSDFSVINCKKPSYSALTTIAQPQTGSFGNEEIKLCFRVSQKRFFATSFSLFFCRFFFFPLEAIGDQ